MTKHEIYGGDALFELRNLAVPFVLLLAKNGMDYLHSKKERDTKVKKTPSPKGKKGGDCGCTSKGPRLGGNDEFTKLAENLNSVMNSYKI